jgi:hypothetical protein
MPEGARYIAHICAWHEVSYPKTFLDAVKVISTSFLFRQRQRMCGAAEDWGVD